MRSVVVLAVLAVAVSGRVLELDGQWSAFKSTYKKTYLLGEDLHRRAIWKDNLDLIRRHNLAADRGEHTYWLGENEYADLEKCGSCWAFSTTGSLEGQTFKKTGKLTSLSEQNLVDCSKAEGNKGCHGGLMDKAFTYIKKNSGIDTETSYPYRGVDGICRFKKDDVGATDTGFKYLTRGSEEALMMAVAEIGPISVAMDAGHSSFQLYRHGVYSEPRCSSTKLDHGVLAVGYGTYEGKEYWLVKNSWGTYLGSRGLLHVGP